MLASDGASMGVAAERHRDMVCSNVGLHLKDERKRKLCVIGVQNDNLEKEMR